MRRTTILFIAWLMIGAAVHARPVVIAHRGASGYLPEHTLAAAAYAHALGADYIEQDLVMSRDDVLVVLHDVHLEMTTNVAAIFPDRARADGRYYAIDFDWSELQQLRANERINVETGQRVYPDRFPIQPGPFRLCRLEEQITLIQGLNQSTERNVGIYPEIKSPSWHAEEGKDLSAALMPVLERFGYLKPGAPIFVQCFEASELKRLRSKFKTNLPLIQLIGLDSWNHANADYDSMLTAAGLKQIATYAQGIGPHLNQILASTTPTGTPILTPLVAQAHRAGLLVHPYTFRTDELPEDVPDFDALVKVFIDTVAVDGLFTDHPDQIVNNLSAN